MRSVPRTLALVLLAVLAACGGRGDEALRVDAAASLREVVVELAALHAERTGRPLPRVNLAGSGELARQIEAARKTDVFLSAGREELDRLGELGLVRDGTRRTLCTNALVVVARDGDAAFRPADLLAADRVAVAHAELVPAGRYATAWLRDAGLLDALDGKLTRSANVRAALTAVESGAATYGVVYATDVATAPGLQVVYRVPPASTPLIAYVGAVLEGAPHAAEAGAFLELCSGPDGRAVFERHGFSTPSSD